MVTLVSSSLNDQTNETAAKSLVSLLGPTEAAKNSGGCELSASALRSASYIFLPHDPDSSSCLLPLPWPSASPGLPPGGIGLESEATEETVRAELGWRDSPPSRGQCDKGRLTQAGSGVQDNVGEVTGYQLLVWPRNNLPTGTLVL